MQQTSQKKDSRYIRRRNDDRLDLTFSFYTFHTSLHLILVSDIGSYFCNLNISLLKNVKIA